MADKSSVTVNNKTYFDDDEFGYSAVGATASVGVNPNGTEKSAEERLLDQNNTKQGSVDIDFTVSPPDANDLSRENRIDLHMNETTSSEGSFDWKASSDLGELRPSGLSRMSGVIAETTRENASTVSGHATVVGEETPSGADDAVQSPAPHVGEFQVSLGAKYGADGDLEFFEPTTVSDLSDIPVRQDGDLWWLPDAEQPDFFYRINFELDGEEISIVTGDEVMLALTRSPGKISELVEEQWQALEASRENQPSDADAGRVQDSPEQAPALSEEITHDDLFTDAGEDISSAPGFEFDVLRPSDLDPFDLDIEGLPFLA
ncbi:hypothetical protein [Chelativorans xinjiangense]|uniref:hypothetical protein n=1 Tax=Chelativorans xinjiangense TaxID=2681485 RepID=UPI00135806EA|nr:hypothetical protein [Chelativorans xinjiangense]